LCLIVHRLVFGAGRPVSLRLGIPETNEWKKTPDGKQPYAIVGANRLLLAMVGLWERWKELCGAIHDRMPAILPRDKWAAWPGGHEIDTDELRWMVLRPYPAGLMRVYLVDVRVGNVRNNEAALLDPLVVAA